MNAEIKPLYKKDRLILGEQLPLDTPYRMTISPMQLCNFKCFYCTHSLDRKEVEKIGFKYRAMELEEFKTLVDQLSDFKNKLKLMVFSGMGEPTLNKNIDKMIKYAKESGNIERVEMFTNGSLLTNEMSDRLINSGLDRLMISLQGVTAEKYKEVCKYNINYDEFVNNIKYYYEHKGKLKLYIKIVDASLNDGDDKNFFDIYGNICDEIFIEHLSDCQPLTNDCDGKVDYALTMYYDKAKETIACPLLFYSMYADADCNIYPCVTLALPTDFSVGNFRNEKLIDIWNGENIKKIRLSHLNGKRKETYVCKDCGNMMAMYHEEDNLDNYLDKLLPLYNK